MINKNEIIKIITISIILGFCLGIIKNLEHNFLIKSIIIVFLALSINIIAKKITSFYLDSEIEIKIWEIKRFGWRKNYYFKKPIPAGVFIPLITSVLTIGNIVWLSSLVYETKPKIYKAAKRHNLYKFSEMSEYHIGSIAAIGVVANLVFAVIGYLIGFEYFSSINIYMAFFNMIPISDLDGNKILFGSPLLWSFLGAITLIFVGYALLLV
ncbi:MAG: hypothetical protein ACOC3Z_02055 [Nanoarchaeota archaeon]